MAYGTVNADLMTTSDGVSSSGLYGFKNRIINGAMVIDQRNAGASLSSPSAYTLDRWYFSKGTSTATYTVQQSSTAPTGFRNSFAVNVTSGATTAAGQYSNISQFIEGYNISDLMWGTANAQPVTFSFWVRSSLTGTFGVDFRNNNGDRNYIASYTISSANTWEYKTISIAGDTSGTWETTNGIGIGVYWDMGVGTTYSSTAGAWTSSNVLGLTGGVKVLANTSASWYVTGVQLEKGSTATSFDYRPYGTELQLCQRYFWRMNGVSGGNATFASAMVWGSTDVRAVLTNPVIMRAVTTVSITGTNFGYANSGSVKTLATINAADQTSQTALLYSGAGTTSATVGQAAQYVITNVDSYISVSAEL
jgi:hypothetical protein